MVKSNQVVPDVSPCDPSPTPAFKEVEVIKPKTVVDAPTTLESSRRRTRVIIFLGLATAIAIILVVTMVVGSCNKDSTSASANEMSLRGSVSNSTDFDSDGIMVDGQDQSLNATTFSWPDLVGMEEDFAKAIIKKEKPGFCVWTLPASDETRWPENVLNSYNPHRVIMFVHEENNTVSDTPRPPQIG
jgi:nitrate reductase NapE component